MNIWNNEAQNSQIQRKVYYHRRKVVFILFYTISIFSEWVGYIRHSDIKKRVLTACHFNYHSEIDVVTSHMFSTLELFSTLQSKTYFLAERKFTHNNSVYIKRYSISLAVKLETMHKPAKPPTNHSQTSQTTHKPDTNQPQTSQTTLKPAKYQTNHPLISQKSHRFFPEDIFMKRNIFLAHCAREEK